jgi:hypothetical protein
MKLLASRKSMVGLGGGPVPGWQWSYSCLSQNVCMWLRLFLKWNIKQYEVRQPMIRNSQLPY